MVDGGQGGQGGLVVEPALDGEGALRDLGQHHDRVEGLGHLIGTSQPAQGSQGHQDGVVASGLGQAGRDVAA